MLETQEKLHTAGNRSETHTKIERLVFAVKSTCVCSEMQPPGTEITCSWSQHVILYAVTDDCGEESLLGKTE